MIQKDKIQNLQSLTNPHGVNLSIYSIPPNHLWYQWIYRLPMTSLRLSEHRLRIEIRRQKVSSLPVWWKSGVGQQILQRCHHYPRTLHSRTTFILENYNILGNTFNFEVGRYIKELFDCFCLVCNKFDLESWLNRLHIYIIEFEFKFAFQIPVGLLVAYTDFWLLLRCPMYM